MQDLPKVFLRIWEWAGSRVHRESPFWGACFNNRNRQANSGEPRSVIRLMDGPDLLGIAKAMLESDGTDLGIDGESEGQVCPTSQLKRICDRLHSHGARRASRFADFDGSRLLSSDRRGERDLRHDRPPPPFGGVPLPDGWSRTVDKLYLLPPTEATPDLPLRVGLTAKDFRDYEAVLRDQGSFKTCASMAVAVGLDLLVRRRHRRGKPQRFSPAWLHALTGKDVESGRRIEDVVRTLGDLLPCRESLLPYSELLPRWHADGHIPDAWQTSDTRADSVAQTGRLGRPQRIQIPPTSISRIKAFLAAGWVVVVSTSVTDVMYTSRALNDVGLPLVPLPGQNRLVGHAWLLVGYDTVDGNNQWKYQGHFLALNSWGVSWPHNPLIRPGICALPFAMVAGEGIDAWAMRFPN